MRAAALGIYTILMHDRNLRKVKILLDAFERARKTITYYALDLSKPELERTLKVVQNDYKHVKCYGLLGTYDEGLQWLKTPEISIKPKYVLWMGSSMGNLGRREAADFLRSYSAALGPKDLMIIGLDACQDEDKIWHAYNDSSKSSLSLRPLATSSHEACDMSNKCPLLLFQSMMACSPSSLHISQGPLVADYMGILTRLV